MKHETCKHDQVQANERSTTHRRGSKTKPRLAWGSLTTSNWMPCCFGLRCRDVAGIALVHKGDFDRLAGHLLHSTRQLAHLRAILFIGGRDQQGQQVAQRIDGRMHFAAFAPLGSIIAGMTAAFGRRVQSATIKDGRRGLSSAPFGFAQSKRRSSTRAAKQPAASQRSVC